MGVPENSNITRWYFRHFFAHIVLLAAVGILILVDFKLVNNRMELLIAMNGIIVFIAVLAFTNMVSNDPTINSNEFRRAMIAASIAVFFTVLAIESTRPESKIYENLVGILIGAITTFVGIYTGSRLKTEMGREEDLPEEKEGN